MFWIHHISLSSLFSSSSSLGSAELLLWDSCCFVPTFPVFLDLIHLLLLKVTLSFESKIKIYSLKLWALVQRDQIWRFELWIKDQVSHFEALSFESKVKIYSLKLVFVFSSQHTAILILVRFCLIDKVPTFFVLFCFGFLLSLFSLELMSSPEYCICKLMKIVSSTVFKFMVCFFLVSGYVGIVLKAYKGYVKDKTKETGFGVYYIVASLAKYEAWDESPQC